MLFVYKSRFDSSFKKLTKQDQQKIEKALRSLYDLLEKEPLFRRAWA